MSLRNKEKLNPYILFIRADAPAETGERDGLMMHFLRQQRDEIWKRADLVTVTRRA